MNVVNPGNETWKQLFCQNGPDLTCPSGAGPVEGRSPRHAFVWTDQTHTHRMECGSAFFKTYYEPYTTYTGYRTLATGPDHKAFPTLPRESPTHQSLSNATTSRYNCDIWFRDLVLGREKPPAPRTGFVEGVLLATRFTNKDDRSKDGTIDYMGQRLAGQAGKR